MSSNEIQAFVFPERPQDAKVTLEITVFPGEGGSFPFSAALAPGGKALDQFDIGDLLRYRNLRLRAGIYTLECTADDTTVTSSPMWINSHERDTLVYLFQPAMDTYRTALVHALEAFPSAQTITVIARILVAHINIDSILHGSVVSITPVVDARTVEIRGIDCIHCGFDSAFQINQFLGVMLRGEITDGVLRYQGVNLVVTEQDDKPLVLVGYLAHDNIFAAFLNHVLATHLQDAIARVAIAAITDILAKNEASIRFCQRMRASILATYDIDPEDITSLADAIEEGACAEPSPPE